MSEGRSCDRIRDAARASLPEREASKAVNLLHLSQKLPGLPVLVVPSDPYAERSEVEEKSLAVYYSNGKPTIVLLYASWCEGCVDLIQQLHTVAKAFEGKCNFVAINMEYSIFAAAKHHAKFPKVFQQVTHLMLEHTEGVQRMLPKFGITTIPHSLFINSDGIVERNGADFNIDEVRVALLEGHGTLFHEW